VVMMDVDAEWMSLFRRWRPRGISRSAGAGRHTAFDLAAVIQKRAKPNRSRALCNVTRQVQNMPDQMSAFPLCDPCFLLPCECCFPAL
jgi:hypothetical protein